MNDKPDENKPAATADGVTSAPVHSPLLRNAIHVGAFVIFAWPIGALVDPRNSVAHGREIVVSFLLFITLLNLLVMPYLPTGKVIRRSGEKFINPVVLYPFSLALCFAVFPPFAALAAWAALAGGDASASFLGRTLPWPKLPWNSRKTWTGVLGFVLGAFPFCFAALWWCPSSQFLKTNLSPEIPFVWTLAVIAAVTGAILESFEGPLDDNLRVPLGVGIVLWLSGSFLSFATRGLPRETFVQPEHFPRAAAVNAALGIAVFFAGMADIPAIIGGIAIGTLVYFFASWKGYILFMAFVVIGCILSKLWRKRKRQLGTEEANEGRRGLSNVGANLLVPALCCLAFPASRGHGTWLLAYAGAISAAFADTASSEIGTLSKAQPILITNFKAVPHGTNGAVSALGFVAALAASLIIATLGWIGGFFELILDNTFHAPVSTQNLLLLSAAVTIAGVAGTIVDSVLGATIEDSIPGIGKGAVNFACTLSGAASAGGLSLLLLPVLK